MPLAEAIEAIQRQDLNRAVVTTESGAEYEVQRPWTRGDNLMWDGRDGGGRIMLSGVRYVDRREGQSLKTVGVIAAVGVGVFAVLFSLAYSGGR